MLALPKKIIGQTLKFFVPFVIAYLVVSAVRDFFGWWY